MTAMFENNPCKDCKPPKRNATCHGTCKAYLEWSERNQKLNAEIKRQQVYESYAKHSKPVKRKK